MTSAGLAKLLDPGRGGERPPFALLEDRTAGGRGARLFVNPVRTLRCATEDDKAALLAELEAELAKGRHAVGYFAYDLGRRRRLGPPLAKPLLLFGLFETEDRLSAEDADAAFARVGPPPPLRDIAPRLSEADYVGRLNRLLDYIAAGDVYQVNFTFPFRFQYQGDPMALYAALRAAQPVAHGAVIALEGAAVLSVSPELHLEVQQGRATTRPMKGTLARGATSDQDAQRMAELVADPKQRAENLMIVDLMRNDLSRISKVGSVRVQDIYQVETYPTFHALTSTVVSDLRDDVDLAQLLQAVFPCGSVTGAPKMRAMEIIDELEHEPRGIYTGGIGVLRPGGDMDLNVAIRTAVIQADGSGVYSVGSGVVADSDPVAEYQECLLKAKILDQLTVDFTLIETFRTSPHSGAQNIDRHRERMRSSAACLGFNWREAAFEVALAEMASRLSAVSSDQRARLELDRTGRVTWTLEPLAPLSPHSLTFGLYPVAVDRADPFLRHKTSQRHHWDAALSWAKARGLDDAISLNRQGWITEASRFNVFVRQNDLLLTPPFAMGVLPGILRQALLAEGRAREHPLRLEDLNGEVEVFVGNSLRGLVPARFCPGA